MATQADTDVLIIGAGSSGLAMAVQLVRNYGTRNFELIEKVDDVGGTWKVNTYPGCGCDVASHFYSYSFELNPDWSQKFSMQGEIQAYFRSVAEKYDIIPHIRFHSTVELARWNDASQLWEVTVKDQTTKETYIRHARIVVSAVGSLSVPQKCKIPGADTFQGHLFHSATWDHRFDWTDKDVVVLGNGCSATQFVPVMSGRTKRITQFARQPHYLAERPNPKYSETFKRVMRYVPLAMRLYRFKLYADMEKDFAGFDIKSGVGIRKALKEENERYVKRMAPEKYWNVLIPEHEIGCKRKVMDTDYLATLHKPNVELIATDPVQSITPTGVLSQSGRDIPADAIILATGFEVFRMLFPMEIHGRNGGSLNEYWEKQHVGAAQAYLGTCIPGFPNFFILMGPNTVTGHLSVIYTVECQINMIMRLIDPILTSIRQSPLRRLRSPIVTSVDVKAQAAKDDSNWMQEKLSKLVWASGCTSWALDPKTGMNIAMYPQYQFLFWLRSVFIPSQDFEYVEHKSGQRRSLAIGGWKAMRQFLQTVVVASMLIGGAAGYQCAGGLRELRRVLGRVTRSVLEWSRRLLSAP